MRSRYFFPVCFLIAIVPLSFGQNQKTAATPKNGGDFSNLAPSAATKVPAGTILVKGAWSSASDAVTPVPEGGGVNDRVFSNQYFQMSYPLPPDFEEKFKGPPPSETGRYVLLQASPSESFKGAARATVLVTAEDLFFTPFPANNALDLVRYSKNHLQADYKLEMRPTPTQIAGRDFTFYAYWSPIADLHWYVFDTEIRCHAVEIVMNSRDTKLLEHLVLELNRVKLPEQVGPTAGQGGGNDPVCIKDYARDENMLARVDPVFSEHRFNPVPVRIIIDKEGKVKHIHFLSAFPDQAKAITEAVNQWRFKRYVRDGKPAEVETGIMFGRNSLSKGHLAAEAAAQ